ncbi:MAG: anaerobic ribonucleoside-triphosphate reductase activating protein [Bacilli bacterium]|nr:anaerobic ribonucleoside-triphosphate reductase activating protein [Bacilli bacterium]
MNIVGLEKLSLSDYPGMVACVIFTQGCNFKCNYCHNSSLISFDKECLNEKKIFEFLEKRKKILDGVVISGGEALLQKDIKFFIKKVKDMGFKIKLDTNGSYNEKLKELLDEGLVDYVAMDIKHDKDHYSFITGFKKFDYDSVKMSIKLLESSNIEYEFRTTIVKEFHDLKSIENICQLINKKSKYYLQNFVDSPDVLNKKITGFSKEELKNIEHKLKEKYSNVFIRGI